MERTDTVIVGGGQAGLATSYFLTQYGREHVILEQAARAGNTWRTARWDSFTLVTPNWTVKLPGGEYEGPDRDGYMPRDEIAGYLERYAERIKAPVLYDTNVVSVESVDGKGYLIQTNERTFGANNVVMATGFERLPKIPPSATSLSPEVKQLHSSKYRNPQSLPTGAVLVVGSAQSGCQIAEELYQSGRQVFLCTGGAGRVPRRYRGKDVVERLYQIGFFNMTPDKLPVPREHFAPPHVSGKNGGRTLNLHQFARDGVTLLGHFRAAAGDKVSVAPDLPQNLAKADGFDLEILKMVDDYIRANGLDAPEEELPRLRDGFEQPIIEELDLRGAGINTVVWATGYRPDFGVLRLPVLDREGFPIQASGVGLHPGLYFVGMPFMPSLKTGTLMGVGESARHVVDDIAGGRAFREGRPAA